MELVACLCRCLVILRRGSHVKGVETSEGLLFGAECWRGRGVPDDISGKEQANSRTSSSFVCTFIPSSCPVYRCRVEAHWQMLLNAMAEPRIGTRLRANCMCHAPRGDSEPRSLGLVWWRPFF